jgi:sugar lactone lactonase YvrE
VYGLVVSIWVGGVRVGGAIGYRQLEERIMDAPRALRSGLVVGESPRWHEGRLWLGNWGAAEVLALDEDGNAEVKATSPSPVPFCIDWLPDGRLLLVSGAEAKLLRQEADGRLVTHADLSGLAKGWNEIVVDGRGNVYVNGSDFDFMGGGPFVPGVVALLTPDGTLRQVADGIEFGNGMAVTPDNRTLIVTESFGHRLTAFDIRPDGTLANRRVWAELSTSADGICLDADGAVWAAAVHECVRVGEGGEILDRVPVGEDRFAFACMLGGTAGRTLHVLTAAWYGVERMGEVFASHTGQVLTVEAPAPHAGRP